MSPPPAPGTIAPYTFYPRSLIISSTHCFPLLIFRNITPATWRFLFLIINSMIKSTKKVSYRSTDNVGRPIPSISLQGRHLERHGFHVGDETEVVYGAGFVHVS